MSLFPAALLYRRLELVRRSDRGRQRRGYRRHGVQCEYSDDDTLDQTPKLPRLEKEISMSQHTLCQRQNAESSRKLERLISDLDVLLHRAAVCSLRAGVFFLDSDPQYSAQHQFEPEVRGHGAVL